ncbi:Hypothetical predicted protein [Paramuricea clavata]|uniref:Uncharacterized protein n=1 Tax=Paramuricea clavata TaxID=317549 RepID=A0A6S7H0T9_PARCT|nr:Hypothetical predicted protein [Paramuricea clavata]
MWTNGMIDVTNRNLSAVADVRDENNDVQDFDWFGQDPCAPLPPDDGLSTVEVNEIQVDLPEEIIQVLYQEVNPLLESATISTFTSDENDQKARNPFKEQKTIYFENDKGTPYLYKGKEQLTFDTAITILLLDVDTSKICTKRPNGIEENACFVIDRSRLRNQEDWLITDIGTFENHRGSARLYKTEDGEIKYSAKIKGREKNTAKLGRDEYLVKRVYYRHKKYTDFSRITTTITDHTGCELQLGLVEYRFQDQEHHVSPHKNPRSGKSFVPVAPYTRKSILEKAKGHKGPTTIFDEEVEASGGIFKCDVMADMP